MGRTDTKNAAARTTVTIGEIDMNKLLEELYKELVPDIPEGAVTINMLVERSGGRLNKNKAYRELFERYNRGELQRASRNREYWYWKP